MFVLYKKRFLYKIGHRYGFCCCFSLFSALPDLAGHYTFRPRSPLVHLLHVLVMHPLFVFSYSPYQGKRYFLRNTSGIGGAAVYAMYSKAYTPKKVCMLGYPLAYTKIGATIKTSKKNSICTPPPPVASSSQREKSYISWDSNDLG